MFSIPAFPNLDGGAAMLGNGPTLTATSTIPFMSNPNFDYFIQMLNYALGFLGLSAWISPQTVLFLASNPLVLDSMKLLLLGSFIETGRRIFTWFLSFFTFRYSISGQFSSGDPTYEWLVTYLTSHAVWRVPFDFQVESRSSSRKWRMDQGSLNPVDSPVYSPYIKNSSGDEKIVPNSHTESSRQHHVDFIPSFSMTQFFIWKGYLMEITTSIPGSSGNYDYGYNNTGFGAPAPGSRRSSPMWLYLKRKNADCNMLKSRTYNQLPFVEFLTSPSSKPVVNVYSQGYLSGNASMPWAWGSIQTKHRRPIESLVLDNNMAENLLKDAREFLALEDWYIKAGIPHRRGYLLYGPPGTGKTSTVYTLAGELGLDIYVLSLSSSGLDDTQLAQAVASVPHHGILLVEDIDCAFPSREEEEEEFMYAPMQPPMPPPHGGMRRRPYLSPPPPPPRAPWTVRSNITMSGLLNVLDGVGSEEGKIFFATLKRGNQTNHVDRLDPALLRPGRIDRKVLYTLTSNSQAKALFRRFYPKALYVINDSVEEMPTIAGLPILQQVTEAELERLSETFGNQVPPDEFTVAELQGYLLDHKLRPVDATEMIEEWVKKERQARKDKADREQRRRDRILKARAKEQLDANDAFVRGISRVFAEERGRVEPSDLVSPSEPLALVNGADGSSVPTTPVVGSLPLAHPSDLPSPSAGVNGFDHASDSNGSE